jgi:DNA-binding NtrC family response regulator
MAKVLDILIIDDDELLTAALSDFLVTKGFRVKTVSNGTDGIESFGRKQPFLVLLDQELPDMKGIQVCGKLLELNPRIKIIFITAYPSIEYAVDAMRAGAVNYLSKPFELEELMLVINMAAKSARMEGRLRAQDYEREREREEKRLVGASEALRRIGEQISLAATSDANVLITGDTGVGKNVVAKAIHDSHPNRETFLSINCSAIPENLIEAEYFGHEKGVFTGAETIREGIFELADGGTLLLDEIGEIPIHLQSKLLSVLEDKTIRKIGSSRTIPVDVRVIATTNRDLEDAMQKGRFRQDLYYRLAVFSIHIPPLREHPEDIPAITRHFMGQFCRGSVTVSEDQLKKMMQYPWPGNVRELRNVTERASLLLRGDEIRPADLLLAAGGLSSPGEGGPVPETSGEILTLEEVKNRHILNALKACSGNRSLTARTLGISLSTLKRKLRELAKGS